MRSLWPNEGMSEAPNRSLRPNGCKGARVGTPDGVRVNETTQTMPRLSPLRASAAWWTTNPSNDRGLGLWSPGYAGFR
jgi:hypothetical protein